MPEPAAEVSLTTADVDRLLAAQHPHLRGPVRLVAHGWDNDVFRLGDGLAVRLPRRAAAAQLIANEQRWLPLLAEVLPVAVPAPVAVGVPGAGYPWAWSVVPWFGGARMLDLDPSQRDAFAAPLARALRALHVQAPADAPFNPVRGVALRERDETVRRRVAHHPVLERRWAEALAAPVWDGAPVWVHGDVHPGNMVVDGSRLSALIDFGDMCGGDPACDLAIAWTGFTPVGRAAFRAELGDGYGDATWRRARGWAAAFASLLHDTDDPAMRAMSVHAVEQLAPDEP